MSLCQMLVTSHLPPEAPWTHMSGLIRRARLRAAALGVNGALLFDGERVMQWAEGPPGAVRVWLGQVRTDDEHLDIVPLHQRLAAGPRAAARWMVGYCEPAQLDRVARAAEQAQDALAAFCDVLAVSDVE